jgi:hypothetical protein
MTVLSYLRSLLLRPCRGLLLRSVAEYCGRRLPSEATEAECAVAVMDAYNELQARAEKAEADLRALLAVELGAEPPAGMRVTAELIMWQRLRTKAAQG